MKALLPYVWGAVGGLGVLLAYYGFKRATDGAGAAARRRQGLWLLNIGVALIAASLVATIWSK